MPIKIIQNRIMNTFSRMTKQNWIKKPIKTKLVCNERQTTKSMTKGIKIQSPYLKKKTSYNKPKWKKKLSLRAAKKEIVKDDIRSKFSHAGKLLFSRNE